MKIQEIVQKGWGGFAAITALFYVIMLLMATYPTVVMERWEYLPALLLVMLLMPLIYWCILKMLFHQQKLHEAQVREQLLVSQSAAMQQRFDQMMEAEKQLDIQRHDLRYRLQTISAMLENGELQEVQDYITTSQESLGETKTKHWCLHPVLDAVFAAYFRKAEAKGIRIEAELDIPADIPINAVELSTVFANALENAIHAVVQLPVEKRVIRCKCIRYPQLMFRVSYPYEGDIRFDKDGHPIADKITHGIGTRSIAAYCEKYDAVCNYKAEDGWFSIQIVQMVWTE